MVPLPHSLTGKRQPAALCSWRRLASLGWRPDAALRAACIRLSATTNLAPFPACHSYSSLSLALLQALSRFPTLCSHRKGDGQSLKGAIVYHDGQFNDSRLAVVLACTAAAAGATVVNYCEAVRLLKVGALLVVCWARVWLALPSPSFLRYPSLPTLRNFARWLFARLQDGGGKVVGAVVRDNLSGKEHSVHARTVINAAGPFSDEVRHLSQVSFGSGANMGTAVLRLAAPWAQRRTSCAAKQLPSCISDLLSFTRAPPLQPDAPKMIMPSSGVHVTLPDYYSPEAGGRAD